MINKYYILVVPEENIRLQRELSFYKSLMFFGILYLTLKNNKKHRDEKGE